ncbi:uncharacterized protein LOC100575061 [Acyrthosiphon pisum]|uniref:Uncharacterized protein n=1 Tax=Acyrthosiphon pisum TaxID=7029 RepID=A0A8R1W6G4_ACYPI|nr:uncharacterized protein LOC100575061 [Acyrthosiphon pisum]|eukprot:XP_003245805.1 PREDICTED: uncharacterized protein LOC100575061 [Acyrthosiphon pisum]
MFTKIMSQINNKGIPLTPMSKKMMPSMYKTTVALKTWGLSGLSFGVTSFVLLCYVTEWRTVLQFCPYYNGKYNQLDIEDKLNEIQATADNKERKENSLRDFQHERDVQFDSK